MKIYQGKQLTQIPFRFSNLILNLDFKTAKIFKKPRKCPIFQLFFKSGWIAEHRSSKFKFVTFHFLDPCKLLLLGLDEWMKVILVNYAIVQWPPCPPPPLPPALHSIAFFSASTVYSKRIRSLCRPRTVFMGRKIRSHFSETKIQSSDHTHFAAIFIGFHYRRTNPLSICIT